MKCAVTISIDEDLVKELRNRGANISGTINNFLIDFLKPKKANIEEEEKLLKNLQKAVSLGFINEQAEFLLATIDQDIISVWKKFKEKFSPDYSICPFAEKRKELRDFLNE